MKKASFGGGWRTRHRNTCTYAVVAGLLMFNVLLLHITNPLGSNSASRPDSKRITFADEVRQRQVELAEQQHAIASKLMLDHIFQLQHPPAEHCRSKERKFMVCPVANTCGFGCAIHHVTYCFIAALNSNRTMVLLDDAKDWDYFEPLSTCHFHDLEQDYDPPDWLPASSERVTTVQFWSRPDRGANFLPWASTDGDQSNDPFFVLPHIEDVLGVVPHNQIGDLRVWYVGQIERYLLRPNGKTASQLRKLHSELELVGSTPPTKGERETLRNWWSADWEQDHRFAAAAEEQWQHPIAGMHVRRTDHSSEAPYRSVQDYVEQIERWWMKHQANLPTRNQLRIYLATEEPNVVEEARKHYPQYIFLITSQSGRSSGEGERTGIVHTENLLSDLFHLAMCDFFVGTASSQVTRLVYERQQTYGLEHHNWKTFVSLDSPWYFP